MMKRLRLGVIGAGFVGDAVINGFSTDNVAIHIVDPKYTVTDIPTCVNAKPDIIFLCLPTPSNPDGSVNVDTVSLTLDHIELLGYKGVCVIKSTITPDHLNNFKNYNLRIVYNPEFLTEANAHADFINPHMQVLGGDWSDCIEVEKAYVQYSKVKTVPTYKTDIVTASLIKYTINSWLATKVTFMNELHKLHSVSGAESTWDQFTEILKTDSRLGQTHFQVPGPDGDFGFGGHCLPKDTSAFLHYAESQDHHLEVLRTSVYLNDILFRKE